MINGTFCRQRRSKGTCKHLRWRVSYQYLIAVSRQLLFILGNCGGLGYSNRRFRTLTSVLGIKTSISGNRFKLKILLFPKKCIFLGRVCYSRLEFNQLLCIKFRIKGTAAIGNYLTNR